MKTDAPGGKTPATCRQAAEAAAWALGQLNDDRAHRVRGHIERCAVCDRTARDARDLASRLRAEPDPVPAQADDDRAWARALRLRAEREAPRPAGRAWPRRPRSARWAIPAVTLAATALLMALLTPKAHRETAACARAAEAAAAWLRSAQTADGDWDAARWGAHPRYRVTVASMALLSLLSTTSEANGPVRQGLDFLLKTQAADGRFGPYFGGVVFNQSAALLALARARDQGMTGLDDAYRLGRRYLLTLEKQGGGWGMPADTRPNAEMTAWATLALRADVPVPEEAFRRGVAALDGLHPTLRARVEQNDLAGIVARTDRINEDRADRVRRTVRQQQHGGPLAGSWDVDDPLSAAGGRVYATSVALLTLGDCAAAW